MTWAAFALAAMINIEAAQAMFRTLEVRHGAKASMKAPKGGKLISDELLGIFFEDISFAADGGIFAEMVQNGSFEYSPMERDNWGAATSWRFIRPGHSLGKMEPRMDNPLHPNNPTYMRLYIERVGHYPDFDGWTGVGMENGGFDGFAVKAGQKYDFSAFFRNVEGGNKEVRIVLLEPGGRGRQQKILAEQTIVASLNAWQQIPTTLTPTENSSFAVLQLLVLGKGKLDIDQVSLMPQDTYKGHGLRKDLIQALADMKPKFMRFPGGCVVHGGGDGFWGTYRWKTTLGPRHERKPLKNTWGYHQSMGLGYYEYFQLCEDLGMEPVPILPCGVTCQGAGGGWGMTQDAAPMEEMDEWTQDALDLIEWANGDVTTTWGKKRAEQGHPEPFHLKYLGLGNEEFISPHFIERFKYMYERIAKAHPEIVIVGTVGPGSHPGNGDYDNGWKLADELGLPLVDEHYYEHREYFLNNRQYDNYPRDRKTKVYLGEYAAKDSKLIDALAEGLYLLHVERNADVVRMTSYAPLFARKGNTCWNPDLIYFDNERPYLTCSYYVQKMFGQSAGQYYYGDCVRFEGDKAGLVQPVKDSHYGQSVVLNVKTRRLYVKLCNATDGTKQAHLNLSRFGNLKAGTKTLLYGQPYLGNNFDSQPIAPVVEPYKAQSKTDLYLPPYSFTMLEIAL